jgi:hypothetical protein
MKSILERIQYSGAVSVSDAIELNEKTDGELFATIPKGAYTTAPSGEQYAETVKFINGKQKEQKTYDLVDVIKRLSALKSRYDVILNKDLYGEVNTVLKSINVVYDGKPVKLLSLGLVNLETVKGQIIEIFGDKVELSLNKAISTYDLTNNDMSLSSLYTMLKIVRDGQFDKLEDRLLSSNEVSESFINELESYEEQTLINGLELMVSILSSDKCRKDKNNVIGYTVFQNTNRN